MLPQLPADKANHFAYGAVIAAVGCLVSPLSGAALCLAFAVSKEVYDRVSGKGHAEFWDAIATMLGGAIVIIAAVS